MQAYVLIGPQQGAYVWTADPEPGPNQALIRVLGNGICASDLSIWGLPQQQYPVPLGHEPVGEVLTTGPGLDLAAGTRVTGRFVPSLSELALADAEDLVVVPEGLDPAHALGEPLGCVAEAFRRTPVQLGDRVAVIGAGFMGQVMLQLLSHTPQSALVAIDPREDAGQAALISGADLSFAPADVPSDYRIDDLSDEAGSHGFDVVVEASGSPSGLALATSLVRPHGRLAVLGYHQGPRTVDMRVWNWKAIDVINGHVRDRDLLRRSTENALRMLHAGRIDIARLVTHRYPFAQVDEAFAALRSKPPGFLKSVIVFE